MSRALVFKSFKDETILAALATLALPCNCDDFWESCGGGGGGGTESSSLSVAPLPGSLDATESAAEYLLAETIGWRGDAGKDAL